MRICHIIVAFVIGNVLHGLPNEPIVKNNLRNRINKFKFGYRWDNIAAAIPTRTKKECMKRYKELVEMVKAKKLAVKTTANPS